MSKRSIHTHKADVVIQEALKYLGFIANDVDAIYAKIWAMGKIGAIRTAFSEQVAIRQRHGQDVCETACKFHLKQYIRTRLQNIMGTNKHRAILNTGGKKATRFYVWLEAMHYEIKRENGLISKEVAMANIRAIAQYRKNQGGRLNAAYEALLVALEQMQDDTYVVDRPAVYDEFQDTLFDAV
jgi:hypothetical protein